MKKITSIIAIATLSIAFSTTVSAQVSDDAVTSATIVTPISIVWAQDMNFGNVAVSTAIGTVVLAPAGTRTSPADGVTLPANAGTVTAATFTVSGQGTYTYAITLPTTLELTTASAGADQTMTVNTFTSASANGVIASAGLLSAGGTDTVSVGATLNVGASQVAGSYTNASDLLVTVNYN